MLETLRRIGLDRREVNEDVLDAHETLQLAERGREVGLFVPELEFQEGLQ